MEMQRLTVVTILALAASAPLVQGRPHAGQKPVGCGYESCPKPKPGVLNIHLVAHTHDDVGWLKTVDQYYYGSKPTIQRSGVRNIIDSVLDELVRDPNKRFIYVETAFFWRWWQHQDEARRHEVRRLVESGRLEFIGGSWSMNDEAVVNYMAVIDQFSWGLRKLNETFGSCGRPRVGWQIDPFGHSREQASLFAQMGYDGLFLGRIDYQDKAHRLADKSAEMIWKGSANLGEQAELFTGVLYNGYSPPPGFCFDEVLCDDEPIVDDTESPDYNLEAKAEEFVSYATGQAAHYRSNNVIITMGNDFNYQIASSWFSNMDTLIGYINNHQKTEDKVNIFYSTPSCYLKAVHDSGVTAWPTKEDDFFPYASDAHSFWTGYYTSRPTLKYFERQGNNFLQVCKQLHSLAGMRSSGRLDALREAMGVLQHHDAVAGTEKQHVADDYARLLTRGIHQCSFATEEALSKMVRKTGAPQQVSAAAAPSSAETERLNFVSCLRLNESQCDVSERSERFVVTVFNPQSQTGSQFVRVPVPEAEGYSVRGPAGHEETIQVVPIPEAVLRLPGRTGSSIARFELVFKADDLPALGFRSYFIAHDQQYADVDAHDDDDDAHEDALIVGNEHMRVRLHTRTGLVDSVRAGDADIPLAQNFFYYNAMNGDNTQPDARASGAYAFRPNGTGVAMATQATVKVYKGALVEEAHQTFNEWTSQVVRTYAGEEHTEFEWLVGPIPVDDSVGKEVVSRFATDLDSLGVFYTDSNGRETLRRQRDVRPTWDLELSEAIAGNYYPVTSKISIKDAAKRQSIAVLVDRAQGGSSLVDGEIELMVHRRLLHDDNFGVEEALDEAAFGQGLVARGTHYVLAGADREGQRSQAGQERVLAQRKLLQPWLFFTPLDKAVTFDDWRKAYKMELSSLGQALPDNVHILTLEPWSEKTLLLRLEHFVEKGEDNDLSKEVSVNLENLLIPFKIVRLRETTLAANQWLQESDRLKWKEAEVNSMMDQTRHRAHVQDETDFVVHLSPMQIRTFIIDIKN